MPVSFRVREVPALPRRSGGGRRRRICPLGLLTASAPGWSRRSTRRWRTSAKSRTGGQKTCHGLHMDARHRWLTPAGLAVIALVVLANAGSSVGLGTSGKALLITAGVAVYAASALLFLLWSSAPAWVNVVLLLTMAGASVATHHGDPTGTGGIGLYLGMAFAPLRLDLRSAAVVSAIGVLIFDAQLALEATDASVFILVVDGGAAFFFLGTLLRREAEQRRQVAELLAQLE